MNLFEPPRKRGRPPKIPEPTGYEVMKFWAEVMRDPESPLQFRMKAAECIAKTLSGSDAKEENGPGEIRVEYAERPEEILE